MNAFAVIDRRGPARVLAGPTPWKSATSALSICAVDVSEGRVPAVRSVARDSAHRRRVEETSLHVDALAAAGNGPRLGRVFHAETARHEEPAVTTEIMPGVTVQRVLRALVARQASGVLPVVAPLLVARDAAHAMAALSWVPSITANDVVIGWDGVTHVQPMAIDGSHGKFTISGLTPDAVRGLPSTGASIVHVLGQVLYTLLMGRLPWAGVASDFAALEVIRNSEHLPLNRKDLPDVVSALVLRALQAEPADRWPLPAFAEYLDDAVRALADPAQVAAMWRSLLEEAMPDERREQLEWLEQLQLADLR